MVARRKKVAREDSQWELDDSPWEEDLPWDGNQWVDTEKLPWEGECYVCVMFFSDFSLSRVVLLFPFDSFSHHCRRLLFCRFLVVLVVLVVLLFLFLPHLTSPTLQTIHVWHCTRRASNSRS